MRDNNHMTISIDTGKVFDKIQHPFMIKDFQSTGYRGDYHSIINVGHIWQDHIIFNCEKLKAFPLRSGTR